MKKRLAEDDVRKLLAEAMGEPDAKALDRACETYRKDPRSVIFGYEKGKEILGLIGVHITEHNKASIRHIGVDFFYRKHGIGREMVQFVMERLTLNALSAEASGPAVEFYRACGFKTESLGTDESGPERFWCTLTRY